MDVEMDTLSIARTLGKAGMEQELAETVVDTLKAVVKPLATTNDVERVGERMKGVEDRMGRVETSMEGFRTEMREFKVEMKEVLAKNEAGMKELLAKTEAGMKENLAKTEAGTKENIKSLKWFFGIAIGILGLVGTGAAILIAVFT